MNSNHMDPSPLRLDLLAAGGWLGEIGALGLAAGLMGLAEGLVSRDILGGPCLSAILAVPLPLGLWVWDGCC